MTTYYALDVSGGLPLFKAMEEINRAPEGSKIIFFDKGVKAVRTLPITLAEVKVRYGAGGGGAMVQSVFDWLINNDPTADVFIYTDGYLGDGEVVKHSGRAAVYGMGMKEVDMIHLANLRCFDHVGVL